MVLEEQGIYDIVYNGRQLRIETTAEGKIILGDKMFTPQITTRYSSQNMTSYLVQINDFQFRIEFFNGRIFLNGKEVDFTFRLSIQKIEKTLERTKSKQGIITAMIPGTITSIIAKEGTEVQQDQPIMFLEAMKMRNELRSPFKGILEAIHVKLNQKVTKGEILFIVKPL